MSPDNGNLHNPGAVAGDDGALGVDNTHPLYHHNKALVGHTLGRMARRPLGGVELPTHTTTV